MNVKVISPAKITCRCGKLMIIRPKSLGDEIDVWVCPDRALFPNHDTYAADMTSERWLVIKEQLQIQEQEAAPEPEPILRTSPC